jgi:hypothetical protein
MQSIRFIILCLCLPVTASVYALPQFKAYTNGHMDIGIRFNGNALEAFWLNESANINGFEIGGDFDENDLRALAVFDAETPPPNRPSGNQWDFLGVAAGEPIYILPSGGVPETVPYLGFSIEDPSLTVLATNFNVVAFRFVLVDMIGPENSVVNVYTNASNIGISTYESVAPYGYIRLQFLPHEHFNISFSQLGTYDLVFRLEALDNTDNVLDQFTNEATIRFQITNGGGYLNYDQWRRTLFTLEDFEEAEISGIDADPLGDGRSNLQRYAFGEFHEHSLTWVEHAGDSYPALRLTERVGMEDMSIVVESSTNLQNWHSVDVVLYENEGRVFHNPGLETRVYRLTDNSNSRAFLRARAELTPED